MTGPNENTGIEFGITDPYIETLQPECSYSMYLCVMSFFGTINIELRYCLWLGWNCLTSPFCRISWISWSTTRSSSSPASLFIFTECDSPELDIWWTVRFSFSHFIWKRLVYLLLGDPQVMDCQLLYSRVCIFGNKTGLRISILCWNKWLSNPQPLSS